MSAPVMSPPPPAPAPTARWKQISAIVAIALAVAVPIAMAFGVDVCSPLAAVGVHLDACASPGAPGDPSLKASVDAGVK